VTSSKGEHAGAGLPDNDSTRDRRHFEIGQMSQDPALPPRIYPKAAGNTW